MRLGLDSKGTCDHVRVESVDFRLSCNRVSWVGHLCWITQYCSYEWEFNNFAQTRLDRGQANATIALNWHTCLIFPVLERKWCDAVYLSEMHMMHFIHGFTHARLLLFNFSHQYNARSCSYHYIGYHFLSSQNFITKWWKLFQDLKKKCLVPNWCGVNKTFQTWSSAHLLFKLC